LEFEIREKDQELKSQTEQHESQLLVKQAIFKEQEALLNTQHNEQLNFLAEYHKQLTDIMKDNPIPDPHLPSRQQKEKDQLETDQKEQCQLLLEKQNKETEQLEFEQLKIKDQLKAQHLQRKSRLTNPPPLKILSSPSPPAFNQSTDFNHEKDLLLYSMNI